MSVPADHEVPVLEYDETIPPRPEEEVADVARSTPDRAGHGGEPSPAPAVDTSAPDA
ncbi:hypothetical protein [Cellulomonas soli]|uniref:Uncharacterized protein n=1 Tax=Cellulomonas soli TaxID=931535 RepID=A0A512PAP7_9CELL|nr:hypothetical protein [Cellulomonas soli]NYI60657.1 hypothetical protein [Cellulomonas soli]GEP68172.1 hypothetical protein CSO01_08870 [Cellulomonas soli]